MNFQLSDNDRSEKLVLIKRQAFDVGTSPELVPWTEQYDMQAVAATESQFFQNQMQGFVSWGNKSTLLLHYHELKWH